MGTFRDRQGGGFPQLLKKRPVRKKNAEKIVQVLCTTDPCPVFYIKKQFLQKLLPKKKNYARP